MQPVQRAVQEDDGEDCREQHLGATHHLVHAAQHHKPSCVLYVACMPQMYTHSCLLSTGSLTEDLRRLTC